uniref:Uncharacterized protein n=1 Tax=Cucumis melo TaxID=3656 RepID=A0A9I9EBM9_CUCME
MQCFELRREEIYCRIRPFVMSIPPVKTARDSSAFPPPRSCSVLPLESQILRLQTRGSEERQ